LLRAVTPAVVSTATGSQGGDCAQRTFSRCCKVRGYVHGVDATETVVKLAAHEIVLTEVD